MRECVRDLCILSVFCGVIISLCPEGGTKKILHVLETTLLLCIIIRGTGKLDLSSCSIEAARFHELERELLEESEEIYNRLDRLVIEEEYASYILGRAEAGGIQAGGVVIHARWRKEGLWVPDSSRITVPSEDCRRELAQILSGELGIPPEKQEWIVNG